MSLPREPFGFARTSTSSRTHFRRGSAALPWSPPSPKEDQPVDHKQRCVYADYQVDHVRSHVSMCFAWRFSCLCERLPRSPSGRRGPLRHARVFPAVPQLAHVHHFPGVPRLRHVPRLRRHAFEARSPRMPRTSRCCSCPLPRSSRSSSLSSSYLLLLLLLFLLFVLALALLFVAGCPASESQLRSVFLEVGLLEVASSPSPPHSRCRAPFSSSFRCPLLSAGPRGIGIPDDEFVASVRSPLLLSCLSARPAPLKGSLSRCLPVVVLLLSPCLPVVALFPSRFLPVVLLFLPRCFPVVVWFLPRCLPAVVWFLFSSPSVGVVVPSSLPSGVGVASFFASFRWWCSFLSRCFPVGLFLSRCLPVVVFRSRCLALVVFLSRCFPVVVFLSRCLAVLRLFLTTIRPGVPLMPCLSSIHLNCRITSRPRMSSPRCL